MTVRWLHMWTHIIPSSFVIHTPRPPRNLCAAPADPPTPGPSPGPGTGATELSPGRKCRCAEQNRRVANGLQLAHGRRSGVCCWKEVGRRNMLPGAPLEELRSEPSGRSTHRLPVDRLTAVRSTHRPSSASNVLPNSAESVDSWTAVYASGRRLSQHGDPLGPAVPLPASLLPRTPASFPSLLLPALPSLLRLTVARRGCRWRLAEPRRGDVAPWGS